MGFTPVNQNKHAHGKKSRAAAVHVKKSTRMVTKIANPRPLHLVNASQAQPNQPNPYAYAQQKGRANPPLDPCFLKRTEPAANASPRPHYHDVQEVPTLHPTESEFSDPDTYIQSLRKYEKYGMVKVVPPPGWIPPLALDTELFTFRSKHQYVNETIAKEDLEKEFNAAVKMFYETESKRPNFKHPLINKRPLDLYMLHRSVHLRGGITEVSRKKLWQQIGRELGYSGKIMSSLSTSLRNAYQKFLTPFDEYLAKNGVNLSSSPRIVRYKVTDPNEEPKKDAIVLSCGITVTLDCATPESIQPEKKPYISNSDTNRTALSDRPWLRGHYCLPHVCEGRGDGSYNLKQFQLKAKSFHDTYFRTQVSEQDIENEYWRLLESPGECLDVEYGYGLSSASGFSNEWRNPWNFNLLSLAEGSYLRYIDNNRMSKPTLRVGMLFASKAWAAEPYFGLNISINHLGATRTWYSVPASHFERMYELLPIRSNKYMLSPRQLAQHDIPCYAVDQRPGEIVVVLSKSWHSHFNHGFNLVETVNYLPKDWLSRGKEAVQAYRKLVLQAPFSFDELILEATESDNCSILRHATPELEEMYKREKGFTQKFPRSSKKFERQVCTRTCQDLYLSWVDTPEGPVCPARAKEGEGELVTLYDDVDLFFETRIATAQTKLDKSRRYIDKVCMLLKSAKRLSSKTLESLTPINPSTFEEKSLHGQLMQQVHEAAVLSNQVGNYPKLDLTILEPVLQQYEHMICREEKLDALEQKFLDYNMVLHKILDFAPTSAEVTPQLQRILNELIATEVSTPIQDAMHRMWNNVLWVNQMNDSISAEPIIFVHQLRGVIDNLVRAGVPPQSAVVQFFEGKKKASFALNAQAERVASAPSVDPAELQGIIEAAATIPIDEPVYARLQVLRGLHRIIEQLMASDPSQRPRLSEAAKYRLINAQISQCVMSCEGWIQSFGHPDQLLVQIQAASINGPLQYVMQANLGMIMQLLDQMDMLQVIPDNFEVFYNARQMLRKMVSERDHAKLASYGFV